MNKNNIFIISKGAINNIVPIIKVDKIKELKIDIKKNVVSPTDFDLITTVAMTSEEFLFKCIWYG